MPSRSKKRQAERLRMARAIEHHEAVYGPGSVCTLNDLIADWETRAAQGIVTEGGDAPAAPVSEAN